MSVPGARTRALFISDLHLQAAQPSTVQAFLTFLEQRAMASDALYILGDLFEYWAGDDDLDDPFNQAMTGAVKRVSDSGVAVYWLVGNRDFLAGPRFAQAAGAVLLAEPHVAQIAGQRIVLVHGDAECTDDTRYMAFRAMVRQSAWQAQFLALPLAQRKAIIAGLRQDSRAAHDSKSYDSMDVTPEAVERVFTSTDTIVMIHGHTHRPALHVAGATRRYVLPDWEPDATPPRGGWIAIDAAGIIARFGPDGAVLDYV